MNRAGSAKSLLVLLVVTGVIALFFAACTQAQPDVPTATIPWSADTPLGPHSNDPTVTLTAVLPTQTSVARGQEPPACSFPLAQTTAAELQPEDYTFSEPKVVLTDGPGDGAISIFGWLPDNQRVLIGREYRGNAQQDIDLFTPQTGKSQVYAVRGTIVDAPPSWVPNLNAAVYPAMNIFKIDQKNHRDEFTRQVWASQGDPKRVQLVADNTDQFYVAMKPDGSEITYLSVGQLAKRSTSSLSFPASPSIPFDITEWASPLASFQAAWRPNTSQVFLYNTSYSPGDPGYTFLLDVDNGQICGFDLGTVKNEHAWAAGVRWSPDGRYLAMIRTSGSLPIDFADLAVLDMMTGQVYAIEISSNEPSPRHYIDDIAWAPDGRHLVVIGQAGPLPQCGLNCSEDSGLYLVDFISGQNSRLLPTYQFPAGWWGTNLAWSPDGSKLLAGCSANDILRLCLISVRRSGQ